MLLEKRFPSFAETAFERTRPFPHQQFLVKVLQRHSLTSETSLSQHQIFVEQTKTLLKVFETETPENQQNHFKTPGCFNFPGTFHDPLGKPSQWYPKFQSGKIKIYCKK